MTYYCTNCWKEIKPDEKICPYCNADQAELEKETFIKKLIKALNHPEPETQIRAANILSELKAEESIPFLLRRLEKEISSPQNNLGRPDPFIIESLVRAILKLKPHLIVKIKKLTGHNPPVTIKDMLENYNDNR
jgi:HEAT repeat protein